MVTIKELQQSIEEEKKKLKKAKSISDLETRKSELKKELFLLKNRKAFATAGKFTKFIRKSFKTVAPIIKKQARLIREQQLRDDAIARKQATLKKKVKKKITKKKKQGFNILGNLDF